MLKFEVVDNSGRQLSSNGKWQWPVELPVESFGCGCMTWHVSMGARQWISVGGGCGCHMMAVQNLRMSIPLINATEHLFNVFGNNNPGACFDVVGGHCSLVERRHNDMDEVRRAN